MSEPSFAALIKAELAILRERYLFYVDETKSDPVFEGMIRSFRQFQQTLETLQNRVVRLTSSFESANAEMGLLADSFLTQYKLTNTCVADCEKFQTSTKKSTAFIKYKRDLEYNVLQPIRAHLNNCAQIRNIVDIRNRKMLQIVATQSKDEEFDKIDSHLFEWLLIIEEYQGDIFDSLLQTMKYLEYEFFASLAHNVAAVLPTRMEFRPMVEMTPKQMESQLRLEATTIDTVSSPNTSVNVGSGKRGVSDYSKKIVEKIESGAEISSSSSSPVNALSLSTLLTQGFEEGPARRALRLTNNDTQQALNYLLTSNTDSLEVRIPTTLKRLQRLKELRQSIAEKQVDKNASNNASAPLVDSPTEEPLLDVVVSNFSARSNLPDLL